MVVNVQVACTLELEVEVAVLRECVEHVVEEAYPGRDLRGERAVPI